MIYVTKLSRNFRPIFSVLKVQFYFVSFWPNKIFLTNFLLFIDFYFWNFYFLRFWSTIFSFDHIVDLKSIFRYFTKFCIFDQNLYFWPKFRFLIKIYIFDQNLDFWPKFRILTNIEIFELNLDFLPKFRFLTKNLNTILPWGPYFSS